MAQLDDNFSPSKCKKIRLLDTKVFYFGWQLPCTNTKREEAKRRGIRISALFFFFLSLFLSVSSLWRYVGDWHPDNRIVSYFVNFWRSSLAASLCALAGRNKWKWQHVLSARYTYKERELGGRHSEWHWLFEGKPFRQKSSRHTTCQLSTVKSSEQKRKRAHTLYIHSVRKSCILFRIYFLHSTGDCTPMYNRRANLAG